MNAISNLAVQAADFLIYTHKPSAWFWLVSHLFMVIFIAFLIVGGIWALREPDTKDENRKLKSLFCLILFSILLFSLVNDVLENRRSLLQKSPELIINNRGITFHTLGFLPWSKVDYIKNEYYSRRRQFFPKNLFKIILKSDSQWQPKTSSSGPSTFFENKITVKNVLDVNFDSLRKTLNQINPSIKILE